MPSAVASPTATRSLKIMCHDDHEGIRAPRLGPINGAITMIIIRVESFRASAPWSNRSRTIARASTTAALAPSACTMRQPMS